MNIRAEIALHPEVVQAFENLLKKIADAGAGMAETEIAGVIPLGLGTFLRPLVVAAVGAGETKMLALADHWLDGLNQAQPDVVAGDGRAGLISIEEIDTPAPVGVPK